MSAGILQARQCCPGAAPAAVIALAATVASTLHRDPQLLLALFFGVAFHCLSHDPAARPGIEFCARHLPRIGVGLLGARITAEQLASLGWAAAALVIAGVVSTIFRGLLLARRLGMTRAPAGAPSARSSRRRCGSPCSCW